MQFAAVHYAGVGTSGMLGDTMNLRSLLRVLRALMDGSGAAQ
jgi:hypothetical protein